MRGEAPPRRRRGRGRGGGGAGGGGEEGEEKLRPVPKTQFEFLERVFQGKQAAGAKTPGWAGGGSGGRGVKGLGSGAGCKWACSGVNKKGRDEDKTQDTGWPAISYGCFPEIPSFPLS